MRKLFILLSILIGWPVLWVSACEQVSPLTFDETIYEAQLVVTGAVLDRGPDRSPEKSSFSLGGPAWMTVKVDRVLKGELTGNVIKLSTNEPCGYGLDDPGLGTFVFFLMREKNASEEQYRRMWGKSGNIGPQALHVVKGRFKFDDYVDGRRVEKPMGLDELATLLGHKEESAGASPQEQVKEKKDEDAKDPAQLFSP